VVLVNNFKMMALTLLNMTLYLIAEYALLENTTASQLPLSAPTVEPACT
jgi:hypothetical protein